MSDDNALVPIPQPPAIIPAASQPCNEVWTALAKAQAAFESPQRTKEAKIKGTSRRSGQSYEYSYWYAPLEEIERVIKQPLAEQQLSRQQYLVYRGEQAFVRTIIGHSSGQWIASDYPVFASANDNPQQAFAGGVTYARRYGLSLALGLVPEDDDDAQSTDLIDTTGQEFKAELETLYSDPTTTLELLAAKGLMASVNSARTKALSATDRSELQLAEASLRQKLKKSNRSTIQQESEK